MAITADVHTSGTTRIALGRRRGTAVQRSGVECTPTLRGRGGGSGGTEGAQRGGSASTAREPAMNRSDVGDAAPPQAHRPNARPPGIATGPPRTMGMFSAAGGRPPPLVRTGQRDRAVLVSVCVRLYACVPVLIRVCVCVCVRTCSI
eukprot:GHVU01040603.1.p1 GENE.GHVU01040603.1~~GHVU01040603.1.p1  ORF type:complete len:147 (-),score=3.57 GHVU01040603.1:338-778(-)